MVYNLGGEDGEPGTSVSRHLGDRRHAAWSYHCLTSARAFRIISTGLAAAGTIGYASVSYTHLTLPTIYSV